MAARGSPATKKPKCDPSDLTRLPDAGLAAQIEALDAEQRVADAAFKLSSWATPLEPFAFLLRLAAPPCCSTAAI